MDNVSMAVNDVNKNNSQKVVNEADNTTKQQNQHVQNTNNSQAAQQQPQMVSVPLLTLQNVKNILDILGDRGTIKTSEMFGVGMTYNEVIKLIDSTSTVKSV